MRDVAELEATLVGVRALAHVPIPTEKRQQGQRDIAVHVQGVWIRPGDRLYADAASSFSQQRPRNGCHPLAEGVCSA